MLVRQPIVAGQFYPANAEELSREIHQWLRNKSSSQTDKSEKNAKPWAVMLPHAGYIYSGNVAGMTLADWTLPSTLIILCPNHTGRGQMLSVWPEGMWETPLGDVPVDSSLAREIIHSGGNFTADILAHLGEHSIEVLLPFLQETGTITGIVPICVATQNPRILEQAGKSLAQVLKKHPEVGLVISSDMNHYEDEQTTLAKDELALAQACAADPDGLLQIVSREKISMCGAGPLALALYAAKDLGGLEVEVVEHETSGRASGDHLHTVGYAGLHIWLDPENSQKTSATN